MSSCVREGSGLTKDVLKGEYVKCRPDWQSVRGVGYWRLCRLSWLLFAQCRRTWIQKVSQEYIPGGSECSYVCVVMVVVIMVVAVGVLVMYGYVDVVA